MRVLKVVLLSLAGLVAVLVAAVAGLYLYDSIDKEDTFVLEQAAFEDPDYLGRLSAIGERTGFQDFHAAIHRLTRGKGTIFAYRYYSNGSPHLIDDEWYKKVSVWVTGATPSNETAIDLSDRKQALLVFSHGGSAHPRGGCSGYGTSGTVHIVPSGPNYTVTIAAARYAAGISGLSPMQERACRAILQCRPHTL